MKNFNLKIIDEIIKQTSDKHNLVRYLTKILSISKESAYRRIKNQIPFTIEEVVIIVNYFNLSIDDVLDLRSNNNFPFNNSFNVESGPDEIYAGLLRDDIDTMEKLLASKDVKISSVINRIPFRFLPFHALFKLDYCHYLYTIGKIPLKSRFSDIEVSTQIEDLHKKSIYNFDKLHNITCVLDNMFFYNVVKKIQYYYRLGFLSADDLHIMQNELFEMLEKYENLLHNGKTSAGSDYVFYYSYFHIDSTVIFLEYDKNSLLQLWVYLDNPFVIKNNNLVSEIQKRWIDSKIRNSVLITKTADFHQNEMLRNTYKQISNLANNDFSIVL